MKNTFNRKVSAERKVLLMVNAFTPGERQLAGLSSAAIESWRRTAGIKNADDLARILVDMAIICQRLSDRSSESFQMLEPGLMEKFESKLGELNRSLAA